LVEESHAAGLLEGPAYTKPPTWRGLDVPAVLTSGNHAAIARWRREQGLRRTAQRRPELIAALEPDTLSDTDRAIVEDAIRPHPGPVAD
jgi:tRNA (guanine37-N1)-methyltransferase